MSSPVYAVTPTGFKLAGPVAFIAANGTSAKIVVEPHPAAAATATEPAYYGGVTVLDLTASSTDAASKDLIVYRGKVKTTQSALGTGSIVVTAGNVLTRALGSYIADGWRPGDLAMVFAPPTALPNTTVALTSPSSVDGILCTVTSVTATVLTVNGTPLANMTLGDGSRIFNVRHLFRAPVAIAAGTNGTTANVTLLGNLLNASGLTTEIKLGADDALIVGAQAAVAALPAYISVDAAIARY